jgi:hypothetical protein
MTFVKTYKQADLTLTGTMRKAQLAASATKTSRRPNGMATDSPGPNFPDHLKRRASSISTSHVQQSVDGEKIKQCGRCHVNFSPIWWPAESEDSVLCHKCHWGIARGIVNGDSGTEDDGHNAMSNGVDISSSQVGIPV